MDLARPQQPHCEGECCQQETRVEDDVQRVDVFAEDVRKTAQPARHRDPEEEHPTINMAALSPDDSRSPPIRDGHRMPPLPHSAASA
jgi:hypothetical protein